jgi:hypothetical protein
MSRKDRAVAHAQQTKTIFGVVLPVVDPFDSECITEDCDRFRECDTVIAEVGRRLFSVLFEDHFQPKGTAYP